MTIRFLKKCGTKTVAMNPIGLYWIPMYKILERSRFWSSELKLKFFWEMFMRQV